MFHNPLTSARKSALATNTTITKQAIYATGTPTNSTSSLSANATAPQSTAASTSSSCTQPVIIPSFMNITFTAYCDSDLNLHDLDNGVASDVYECHQTCLHRAPCFAVTYTTLDSHCYRKGAGVSVTDLKRNSPNIISILPDPARFNQTHGDIDCPVRNLDTQSTSAGLDFTVLCGATLWGDDLYDPAVQLSPAQYADSLDECLEHCANNHPLCSRVTYDADRNSNLWSSCWLKTAASAKPVPANGALHHSAYAQLPILKSVECKQDAQFTASDGRIFTTSCMDRRILNDTIIGPLATSHESTIDECMGKCSDTTTNCSAIAFDVGLQSGYRNCYLFDSIPPPLEQHSDYTFMYHTTLSSQYRPPPSKPGKVLTKAELGVSIALPGSFLLAIVTLCWFWWRQRSKRMYIPVKGD